MASKSTAKAQNLILDRLKPLILRVARRHGVTNVRVFGSFARGDQRKTSDLDLLVDAPESMSLLDLIGFKIDMEEHIGRGVDVLTPDGISPYLRDRILCEARPL